MTNHCRMLAKLALVCGVLVASAGLARATGNCNLLTLKGTYGFRADATIKNVGPFSAVGVQQFDGAGKFSGVETTSFDGAITEGVKFTGTYVVNSDCTGSMTATFDGGFSGKLNFVIVENGKELFVIEADPGTNLTGIYKRQ